MIRKWIIFMTFQYRYWIDVWQTVYDEADLLCRRSEACAKDIIQLWSTKVSSNVSNYHSYAFSCRFLDRKGLWVRKNRTHGSYLVWDFVCFQALIMVQAFLGSSAYDPSAYQKKMKLGLLQSINCCAKPTRTLCLPFFFLLETLSTKKML